MSVYETPLIFDDIPTYLCSTGREEYILYIPHRLTEIEQQGSAARSVGRES